MKTSFYFFLIVASSCGFRAPSVFRRQIGTQDTLNLFRNTLQSYNDNSMLVRVRSNVAMWKFHNVDAVTTSVSDLAQRIAQEKSVVLTQSLSKHASGQQQLKMNMSLHDAGVSQNGDMLYCRVRLTDENEQNEKEMITVPVKHPQIHDTDAKIAANVDAAVLLPKEESLINNNSRTDSYEVIDLVDSGSDEEGDKVKSPPVSKTCKRSRLPETTHDLASKGSSTHKKQRMKSTSFAGSLSTNQPNETATALPCNSTDQEKEHPNTFQIGSYNVWFGPPDEAARQVHPQQRMQAICRELRECQRRSLDEGHLLVIGFQELTPNIRDHLRPLVSKMNFRFCTQPLDGCGYGVGLAISKSVTIVETAFLPFQETQQGRGILYVETPTLIFCTTHLESYQDAKVYNGVTQRESQIKQATQFCEGRLNDQPNLKIAIISGDFNWDDERKRGPAPNRNLLELLSPGWRDAGTPFDYTYDGRENPMLGGNLRRRFDRCIFRTQDVCPTPTASLQKLGMKAIPNLTWDKYNPWQQTTKTVPVAPSDHFGIAVTFNSSN